MYITHFVIYIIYVYIYILKKKININKRSYMLKSYHLELFKLNDSESESRPLVGQIKRFWIRIKTPRWTN